MLRSPLDTAAVVREAVRFADEQGADALTMRQLGARMGVKAMALYRYIGGREALLDAMVAATMDQLHRTMAPNTCTSTTGPAYLQTTAHDVRNLALTHPWLIRLMVLRPPPARWLSRPLDSLACTETFLEALDLRGFQLTCSISTYRGFCAFLLAHLLIEVSASTEHSTVGSAPGAGPLAPDTRATRLVPARPMLASRLQLATAEDVRAEFERSLDTFLRSVRQSRPQIALRPGPARPDDDRRSLHD